MTESNSAGKSLYEPMEYEEQLHITKPNRDKKREYNSKFNNSGFGGNFMPMGEKYFGSNFLYRYLNSHHEHSIITYTKTITPNALENEYESIKLVDKVERFSK